MTTKNVPRHREIYLGGRKKSSPVEKYWFKINFQKCSGLYYLIIITINNIRHLLQMITPSFQLSRCISWKYSFYSLSLFQVLHLPYFSFFSPAFLDLWLLFCFPRGYQWILKRHLFLVNILSLFSSCLQHLRSADRNSLLGCANTY